MNPEFQIIVTFPTGEQGYIYMTSDGPIAELDTYDAAPPYRTCSREDAEALAADCRFALEGEYDGRISFEVVRF